MNIRSTTVRWAISLGLVGGFALVAPQAAQAGPARAHQVRKAKRQDHAHRPHVQQQRKAKVNRRQAKQAQRVRQGKRSGQITRAEGRKIQRQQRGVKRAERRAKADGVVTKREARKIQTKQNRASRTIHRAKHNDRKRPGAR